MDASASQQQAQVQLRYRKLVDTLPGCVVFVLDPELRVTFAGGGLVTHDGFRPQYYLGRPAVEVASPSVYASIEPYLLATLAGEETSFAFDYPAGPSFEVRTTPLQDGKGPATEILVVALDTTERKHAEAAERAAQTDAAASGPGSQYWAVGRGSADPTSCTTRMSGSSSSAMRTTKSATASTSGSAACTPTTWAGQRPGICLSRGCLAEL